MELIEQLTRQYSSGHMLAMHAQLTSVTTRVKQLQPGTWSHSLPVKNRLKANLVLPDSLNKRWETKRAKDRSQGHQRETVLSQASLEAIADLVAKKLRLVADNPLKTADSAATGTGE